jgi:hypothetical protein
LPTGQLDEVGAGVDFESFLLLPFPLELPESFFDDESLDDPEDESDFEEESDLVGVSDFVEESLPLPADSLPDESLEALFPLPFEPFRESVL